MYIHLPYKSNMAFFLEALSAICIRIVTLFTSRILRLFSLDVCKRKDQKINIARLELMKKQIFLKANHVDSPFQDLKLIKDEDLLPICVYKYENFIYMRLMICKTPNRAIIPSHILMYVGSSIINYLLTCPTSHESALEMLTRCKLACWSI